MYATFIQIDGVMVIVLRLRGRFAPDKQAKSTRPHQQVNEVHGHRETSFGSAATLAIEHQ